MDLQANDDLLRDNEKLHAELMSMVRRRERGSEVTFAGSRGTGAESRAERQKSRDGRPERRALDRTRESEEVHVGVEIEKRRDRGQERGYSREREPENLKLRETLDALEYMKKREKALQEEVKSLSQALIRYETFIKKRQLYCFHRV